MLQVYSRLPLLIAESIFLNETDLNKQKQCHTLVKVHNLHFYFDKIPINLIYGIQLANLNVIFTYVLCESPKVQFTLLPRKRDYYVV
jgi:hypothetical protein